MNRRSAIRNFLIAGAGSVLRASIFSGPVAAQQAGQSASEGSQPEEFVIHSDVRLVLLDVSVKNKRGAYVPNLTRDDFAVIENGRKQALTVFDHDDRPVTAGILVDESRSMTPKRSDTLSAAEIFIQQSNPQDEIFVLNFNDQVEPGLPPGTLFSDDLSQLRAALHRGVPEGRTALNDAVVEGLNQLKQGTRDRKTLIVISDGGDNASDFKRAQVLDMVERSTATIYAIGLFDADDRDRDPGILKAFARISGGRAYFPNRPAQMEPVCREIAEEIRSRYTIGYIPPEGPSAVRHIQVLAASGGEKLVAHTRSRYRYDQEKEAR